ncbi:late endosomal/lysosomal adaptor and MAPK and MTOR activator-like protein [Elsinoe australis]|uniref:Late endosomal/lysosomal adaptor and MAPK and MTOR activator-like protein n=1 Tax=Elsinoe australis TaxID=40998 RepID=A0A4U7BEZ5_9PEZI|nr:late endosomal/lysosomal adaptor and MAPK and MTOR activator-like protein [Elsinoe australis]
MGACLSCLGLSQRASDDEPSESERLLYDETSAERVGYGATGPGPHIPAPDPEELRRHREMLERICAETANNLIDVQHTNLLTLRGKPSAEFATLLNTHFAPPPEPQSPIQASAPSTPNPNLSSDEIPEPPSPFTQAQIQAAQQSNGNGTFNSRTAHDKNSDTAVPQKIGAQSHQQDGDEEADAAEEAWLKEISNGAADFKWDEIKAPQDGLVVDLNDITAPSGGIRGASKTR